MELEFANRSAQALSGLRAQARGVTRRSLLASTALVGAASLLGLTILGLSSERALAACAVAVNPNYVCSGVNAVPQIVSDTNVAVTTAPGFSVDTGGTGSALSISGAGAVSYTDANASTLNGVGGQGLSVVSTGDAGATPGSVTVQTGGNLTGNDGFVAENRGSGASTITLTGISTGVSGNGVQVSNAATATDLTLIAARAIGSANGIAATNNGTGATSVTATGLAAGSLAGITVINASTATDLTVSAATVSGGTHGIQTDNTDAGISTGVTKITASGLVQGATGDGIQVVNRTAAGPGTTVTVVAAAVSGGANGISVRNFGYGSTSIIASGSVIGTAGVGIDGYSAADSLNIRAAAVTGGDTGINARNDGHGVTSVTATGAVIGGTGTGIYALNRGDAPNPALNPEGLTLTINATTVNGGTNGIFADNQGAGGTRVIATGAVTGGADGIHAFNTAGSTDQRIAAAAVSGAKNGIYAENRGTGITSVSATGTVVGTQTYGILAANGTLTLNGDGTVSGVGLTNATDLTVNAVNVTGAAGGIYASNSGSGATRVTTTGSVFASGQNGITAANGGGATSLTVDAFSARGTNTGISVTNFGTGATDITARGVVEGRATGISVSSQLATNILITGADAHVRNSSGNPGTTAISAFGGAVTLTNEARLTGQVQLGNSGNQMTNRGIWTSSGTNRFGAGANALVNEQAGTIVLGSTASAREATVFLGLGSFTNRGVVTLQDGAAGDSARFSGNINSVAGSVYAIDVNSARQSDLIRVDGAATITGTTLDVANQGGYRVGTRYTVLTATGGLTGTYAGLTGDVGRTSLFLNVVDSYDANNAYLDVLQTRTLASVARTPNQLATAGALGTLPTTSLLSVALLNLVTEDQARAAFDSLSGEAHASVKTALIEESHFIRDAAIDRIRQGFEAAGAPSMPVSSFAPDAAAASPAVNAMAYATATKAVPMRAPEAGLAMWGQGFGSWGRTEGDGNAARLNRSTGGVITGFDGIFAQTWRLGFMGGYSQTAFNVRERASFGQSNNFHAGIYGGSQSGALGLRAGAAYTRHDITTARSVAFPGFAGNLTAAYGAGTTQAFGELGYRIEENRAVFEPFVDLAYINLHTDGFTESGGGAALKSAGTTTDTTFTTLGLRASTSFMVGATYATARGTLGWRHAYGDVTPLSTFAFAGSGAFSVAGVPIARNAATIDAGLDFAIARNAAIGISYNGQFGNNASDNGVRGNLVVKF